MTLIAASVINTRGGGRLYLYTKYFTTIYWIGYMEMLMLFQFVFLTYILGVAWLGVFGFSAVPVFLFYNMWSTCAAMRSPMANLTNVDSICVDVRQYGTRLKTHCLKEIVFKHLLRLSK